jgi:predicted porin
MNKNIKLAVAGAILATASVANAGIIIPAGDWTIDIGGNVNAFYTNKTSKLKYYENDDGDISRGEIKGATGNTIGTGLLPAQFGIGAKTRQNDLDVAFQFSFFTGTSQGVGTSNLGAGNNSLNIRQAYLTFGDKSWGQIKLGRDLGVFGSDAILSDMTLLGVGVSPAGNNYAAGGNSTLGRIGSGYIYANWYGQIQYQSPNWNGFQVTVAAQEGANQSDSTTNYHDLAYNAKATYDFAASDVTGRIWVGGMTQRNSVANYRTSGGEIGAKANAHGFGVVGYYYSGKGLDSQYNALGVNYDANYGTSFGGVLNGNGFRSDDDGGYVQASYTVPGIGTKLGASWGRSNSDVNSSVTLENESWVVGAYHPLTKHLNLVAEYTDQEIKANYRDTDYSANLKHEAQTVSLGAILFF